MLTRLMLPSRSISPPERKKTSMRPWPAQSNSSRPPSVKNICLRLPSSDTYGLPPPRSRASSAAVAGIGEALPIATWRTSPISRTITSARSSSGRKSMSGGAFGVDVAVEVAREALRCRGKLGVFGKMRAVSRVVVEQRQRPSATRRHGDGLDIEARHGAGGEKRVFEQIALVNLLHGCDRVRSRMGHGHQLAVAADE